MLGAGTIQGQFLYMYEPDPSIQTAEDPGRPRPPSAVLVAISAFRFKQIIVPLNITRAHGDTNGLNEGIERLSSEDSCIL